MTPRKQSTSIRTVARCRHLTRLPAPMHLCEELRIRHGHLQLLHELVPNAAVIGVLLNPANPSD